MAVNTLSKADTTPRTKVLKNGAVYDLDKGRIVANPGGGSHAITSERAIEFAQLRIDRKRQAIAQAANEAVESGDLRARFGDMAFVADIARVAMMKATTPDDPKAIDAARFLLQEAGISDKQGQAVEQGQTLGAMADIITRLADFASVLVPITINNQYLSSADVSPAVVDVDAVSVDAAGGADVGQAGRQGEDEEEG